MVFVGGIVTGILLWTQIKSGEDTEDALADAKLQGEEKGIDEDIKQAEDDLANTEVEDLTDDEVKDYWDNI